MLLGYCYCMLTSCESNSVDLSGLREAVDMLGPWLRLFDEHMINRTWLVKSMMETIDFDDSEESVKLFGLVILEHAKVCEKEDLIELGVTLILKKNRAFLIQVLQELSSRFPVEAKNERTHDLDACMMQLRLYNERGFLQHTICVTIESIISYRLLEDMLRDKSPHLLKAMNLTADARTLRKKEADDCIANLNQAIKMVVTHTYIDRVIIEGYKSYRVKAVFYGLHPTLTCISGLGNQLFCTRLSLL